MSTVQRYHDGHSGDARRVIDILREEICRVLPEAENKLWHGHPVWFLAGNPVVGYDVLKAGPRLLFWSGQSFEEPGLAPEGSFKAAEARFKHPDEIKVRDLRRWLKKSRDIQWDYKNIVKRKGVLKRVQSERPHGATARDSHLASRVREQLSTLRGVQEKRMFGGIAFLVGGNLSVAASSRGGLLVRVDPLQSHALAKKPHIRPMVMRGRPLKGWLRVDARGVHTGKQLEAWVRRGVAYAQSLPPKR